MSEHQRSFSVLMPREESYRSTISAPNEVPRIIKVDGSLQRISNKVASAVLVKPPRKTRRKLAVFLRRTDSITTALGFIVDVRMPR
jgi:endonuclease III